MQIQLNGNPVEIGNSQIGAFVGDECRGTATPINVNGEWLYFLSIYSNTQFEEISFDVYSGITDEIINLTESIEFTNDLILGSPSNPYLVNIIYSTEFVAPQNVSIQIIENQFTGNQVVLNWDLVQGALSYKILASENPESGFEQIASGIYINNWSEAVPNGNRFYRVVASTDLPVRSLQRKADSKKSTK